MEEGMVFILIILFAFVLPIVIYGTWTSHKKDMAKLNASLNDSEKNNVLNELAAVKSRLEVLEAIVTDKKYQLSQEISDLRTHEKTRVN
jgi:flagellar basal body-associated protein FliL